MKNNNKKYQPALYAFALWMGFASTAFASPPIASKEATIATLEETAIEAPMDGDTLARVNKALQAMPPLSGRFQQKLPNGSHASGTYAIDFPDRLRFAYEVGGTSIVTVKGRFVAVQEAPGGEANWFPVALTPLAVLRQAIRDGISPAMVSGFKLREDNYSLTLHDPSGELPGAAELFFTRKGDRLYAWRLTDVQNLVTLVRLSEIITHEALPRSRFDIVEIEEDDY